MPIRIAIVGGSIAGCTLANGLLCCKDVTFDIFDAKSSFSERGAGVAIAPNARKALRAMGTDAEAALKDAGGMKMKSTYCLIVCEIQRYVISGANMSNITGLGRT